MVQTGDDVERVAVVAILRVVPVRGWERLPRGAAAVYAVHVGHGSTCHAAGIEEDADDRARVKVRATGGKCDDLRDARVAVIVGDEGRLDGSEVGRHGALVVDKGYCEPMNGDVARRLAARSKVDDEVLVADGRRDGCGEWRDLGIVESGRD